MKTSRFPRFSVILTREFFGGRDESRPYGILSVFALLLFVLAPLAVQPAEEPGTRTVVVAKLQGVINPVAAEFVAKAVTTAERERAEALVIELDTPGGLDTSMRLIIQHMLASQVPVVVYVAPSGARAASAGTFITLAAHVAAMAPGTSIGAAHPVAVGEKMDKVMAEKATNDAAAFIRTLAEQRGRNVSWAEDAVRKSVSAGDGDALKSRIIDIVARDRASLLAAVEGRKAKLPGGEKVMHTAGARIVELGMGFRHTVLNLISDPTVAYILMLLGFYGLFFELTNPGSMVPGILGAISLVLAFYAFQTLPVNYAGLLLVVIGIILFVLEIKVTSYGLLTVGGIACLFLGSLMLFDADAPFLKVSLSVIIPAVLTSAVLFALTIRLGWKALRRKPVTGQEGLVGMEGVARSEVGPSGGQVQVHGEIWAARSDEPISKDERVLVEAVRGLTVKVRRIG